MKSKLLFPLISVLLSLLLAIFLAEIIFRLSGEKAFQPEELTLTIHPNESLFEKHSLLGFKMKPGAFEFTYPNGFKWALENDKEGYRVNQKEEFAPVSVKKKICWLLGCSYTYGWSVSNDETFAWHLQQKMPNWEIRNLAQPAFSTLQSYIQIQSELRRNPSPDKIILIYAAFHDERNIGSKNWMNQLAPYNKLGNLEIPVVDLKKQSTRQTDSLMIDYKEVERRCWWPSKFLASLYYLERNASAKYTKQTGESVSIKIIEKIGELCRNESIPVSIAVINSNERTSAFVSTLENKGIDIRDFTIDTRIPGNTNLPDDSHPSPVAHKLFFDKMLVFFD